MRTGSKDRNNGSVKIRSRAIGAGSGGGLLCVALWLAAACGTAEIRPVGIFPEDMCSRCRMAISEKRSAGELILKDGTVLKFDDLGCMVGHHAGIKERKEVAACFVADFEGGGWIDAKVASFVRSDGIKTPMNSGTVAFRSRDAAKAAAERHGGEILGYAEVFAN